METLIDRMFGTCSVKFLSIGTGSNIIFQDIKKSPDLEKNILSKIWIHLDEVQKDIISEFNFLDYVKSQIGKWIILLVLILMIGWVPAIMATQVDASIPSGIDMFPIVFAGGTIGTDSNVISEMVDDIWDAYEMDEEEYMRERELRILVAQTFSKT